jgi:hypothetical protein
VAGLLEKLRARDPVTLREVVAQQGRRLYRDFEKTILDRWLRQARHR